MIDKRKKYYLLASQLEKNLLELQKNVKSDEFNRIAKFFTGALKAININFYDLILNLKKDLDLNFELQNDSIFLTNSENFSSLLFKLKYLAGDIKTSLQNPNEINDKNLSKLTHQREEIEKMKEFIFDDDIINNLFEAISTYEKKCFLGSCLICGRLIDTELNKIKTDTDNNGIEEKIKKLIQILGLQKERDKRAQLLKAAKFSRNFLSHKLDRMPESSETLTALGDTIQVVKLVYDYEEELNSLENK